jgi:hypothetical protein
VVDEAWEQWQRDPGYRFLRRGYVAELHMAAARENRAGIDRAGAAAERLLALAMFPEERALLASYQRDDPAPLESVMQSFTGSVGIRSDHGLVIMFLNDRGLTLPRALLDVAATHPHVRYIDAMYRCTQIASALTEGGDARLAEAIEDAEAHGLIPHAARMRIVLAQRTGDRAHLERARPVLERLGDRQFLRRLEEVAATLG